VNERVRRLLSHEDPVQLLFQFDEIVRQRSYLRHGIEVRPGAVVFDVGANVGVAAVFFAVACGAGSVHSFEPLEPIYRMLKRNTSALPACISHNYGISARSETRPLLYYPESSAMSGLYADPGRDRETVATVMGNLGLDDEQIAVARGRFRARKIACELHSLSHAIEESQAARIDLLKIDVERAELEVLEGIDEQDWPKIRQLVIEVHGLDRCAEVTRMLSDRDFAVLREQAEEARGTDSHLVYASRRRLT
jgi:FkbM family methyltransferase